MYYRDIVPHACVFIDCSWSDFVKAFQQCTIQSSDRQQLISRLQEMWTSPSDGRPVLPCLSVRTGLDLYLQVMRFPAGSEVIMSAINIPDVVQIVHEHGLRVVSMDVDLETTSPKVELFDSLVSDRTVAVLLAHVYGKVFDVAPFIAAARKHRLRIIEDCAEAFRGFDWMGHPDADISLFSFGAIKHFTAFGGAIAKLADRTVYQRMHDLHATYRAQTRKEFFYKILKMLLGYAIFTQSGTRNVVYFSTLLGIDHKKHVVQLMRGFPSGLITRIRHQPSTALLHMMHRRLSTYSPSHTNLVQSKGDYVSERLPLSVTQVGTKAMIKGYWLFPVVVDDPDEILKVLNELGVDAYRGATQLTVVEPDNGDKHLDDLHAFATRYPHEARYIVDHLIYLPVNKNVSFAELDRVCAAVNVAVKVCSDKHLLPLNKIKLKSKL